MVTSNGELLIVYSIVRNGSLWNDVVFEKEIIFHELDFETLDLEFEVSKSSNWKNRTLCDSGFFSFIIILQLRWPIELKLSQVCYFMHMLSEKTGLLQLPMCPVSLTPIQTNAINLLLYDILALVQIKKVNLKSILNLVRKVFFHIGLYRVLIKGFLSRPLLPINNLNNICIICKFSSGCKLGLYDLHPVGPDPLIN